VGGYDHALATLLPRKEHDAYCTEGGVDFVAGPDGCRKSNSHMFESQTVQPAASYNTDYTILATISKQ
jgi:hypothetical protein